MSKTSPATPDPATEACLQDPVEARPLDEELRASQATARALPSKMDAWILVGRGWVRKARFESDPGFYLNADKCAEVALRLEPANVLALELRALVLMNDHRFAEAKKVSEEALARDPESLLSLGTLSDAELELGHFLSASEAAQRLMDLRPNMSSYSRASYFRWLRGDAKTAKESIRSALMAGKDARDPEPTAWTFVQAGMIYWQEGDYEGADAVFAEALKWMPTYPSALVGRARCAMSLGQPRRAIENLRIAFEKSPLPETAWLLGDAMEMAGDGEGARVEYDRVVREGARTDRFTLALFYATKDRNKAEALALIEEEKKTRGGIYIDDAHAWALYRAGRLEEAQAASDRALELETKDARLLYHAGAIRIARGDVASGRKLVEEALRLNPKFDWTGAAEAQRLLSSR